MKHDDEIYLQICNLDHNAFITGSFLVNPEKANDIDMVLVFNNELHDKLVKLDFTRSDGSYNNSNSAHTLMSVWRKGNYNIIVVKDLVAAALWQAFSNIISSDYYDFSDKKERVKLHEQITKSYSYKKESN